VTTYGLDAETAIPERGKDFGGFAAASRQALWQPRVLSIGTTPGIRLPEREAAHAR